MTRIANLFTQPSRHFRWTMVISVAGVCLLVAIAYASIPDASGVIHGCYKRTGGTLRIIDDAVDHCDQNETPLQWNQTGPQGPPGTAAPPRLITIGTGFNSVGIEPMGCSQAIRTKEFVKQSETSTLRITYHDDAFVEDFSGGAHDFVIQVLIDGQAVTPTPIHDIVKGDGENAAVNSGVTAFGFANGIPAGTHTLSSYYHVFNNMVQCWRGSAYTVEIEEISL